MLHNQTQPTFPNSYPSFPALQAAIEKGEIDFFSTLQNYPGTCFSMTVANIRYLFVPHPTFAQNTQNTSDYFFHPDPPVMTSCDLYAVDWTKNVSGGCGSISFCKTKLETNYVNKSVKLKESKDYLYVIKFINTNGLRIDTALDIAMAKAQAEYNFLNEFSETFHPLPPIPVRVPTNLAAYMETKPVIIQDYKGIPIVLANTWNLTPSVIFKIIIDLINNLIVIHNKQIVHQDLKLENIVMKKDENGEQCVTIIDFGLAKRLDEVNTEPCGTSFYVSPEVYLGKSRDFAADIYPLAITIVLLLLGKNIRFTNPATQKPWPNEDAFRAWLSHSFNAEQAVHIADPRGQIDPIFFAFLKTALAFNPRERPSAKEFLEAAVSASNRYHASIADKPSVFSCGFFQSQPAPTPPAPKQIDLNPYRDSIHPAQRNPEIANPRLC